MRLSLSLATLLLCLSLQVPLMALAEGEDKLSEAQLEIIRSDFAKIMAESRVPFPPNPNDPAPLDLPENVKEKPKFEFLGSQEVLWNYYGRRRAQYIKMNGPGSGKQFDKALRDYLALTPAEQTPDTGPVHRLLRWTVWSFTGMDINHTNTLESYTSPYPIVTENTDPITQADAVKDMTPQQVADQRNVFHRFFIQKHKETIAAYDQAFQAIRACDRKAYGDAMFKLDAIRLQLQDSGNMAKFMKQDTGQQIAYIVRRVAEYEDPEMRDTGPINPRFVKLLEDIGVKTPPTTSQQYQQLNKDLEMFEAFEKHLENANKYTEMAIKTIEENKKRLDSTVPEWASNN